MKNLLDLSEVKAYQYFMEPENYCSLCLPIYISFKPVLDFVENKVGKTLFEDVLGDDRRLPSEYENVNHVLLIKKDAKYAFRPIQVTNPFMYYFLVREITKRGNWKTIKDRFKDFRRPQIEVSSIPAVKSKKDKSHISAGVANWWDSVEQRSIALSLEYKYLFITDIANCYPSIYTHSIAWAIMGRDEAKRKKDKKGLLGNIIDRYIQGIQNGQTNGIPQGSVLYDFIAEIVLGYVDMLLVDRLIGEGITEYKILRYRDDYRIFSNNHEELERIAFFLHEVLSGFNFQLNTKKTIVTDDLIKMSIKPDKIAYTKNYPLYKKSKNGRIITLSASLQQEALYIHQFAKEYPDSGTLMKLLTTFSIRLSRTRKKTSESDALALIAILTEIAQGSPKAYRLLLHLISVLLNCVATTNKREEVVHSVYNKFMLIPNIGELQIWMQHITYKLPHSISYSEPICQIVANKPGVQLWNNDWVRDQYKKDFPQYSICTNWLRDSFTPVIDIDEVALFDVYK